MDVSTTTTTMLGSDRQILDRVTERGPASAAAGVHEPTLQCLSSMKNLHYSDNNDHATNNRHGNNVKSMMETKACDEESIPSSSSSKWCQSLQATALQRTKEADEILAAFDDPNRQLLIVKGPSGGM
jgi:hypothetical protein